MKLVLNFPVDLETILPSTESSRLIAVCWLSSVIAFSGGMGESMDALFVWTFDLGSIGLIRMPSFLFWTGFEAVSVFKFDFSFPTL